MRLTLIPAALTVTLLAVGGAHATNLISDGTFTSPSGGASFTEYAGGSSFGPWSVGGDSVDLIGGYWQDPAGTGGSVDLNGSAPGSISQTFATTAGKTYDISFYLAGNPDAGQLPDPAQKVVSVTAGGDSKVFHFTNNGTQTRADMGYQLQNFSFVANGSTTTLSFAGDNSGPYGPVIGDVSVSAVPEPATWGLMIFGIGGIGVAFRQAKRKHGFRFKDALAA